MADRLNALDAVEVAYLPPIPANPDIPPATPDFEGSQGYLDAAAAGGVDARFAWTRPGGRGQGIRIIDIEMAWNLDHEDLPPPFLALAIGGINGPGWITFDGIPANSHGTAVLGIMLAKDDGRGVTGIANGAPALSNLRVFQMLGKRFRRLSGSPAPASRRCLRRRSSRPCASQSAAGRRRRETISANTSTSEISR